MIVRSLFVFIALASAVLCVCAQEAPKKPNQPSSRVVTASQVNGVYRYYKNEFRILALGNNKLKVQFDGVYMTASGTHNLGTASGEASIEGNVAKFKPSDTDHCEITLIFSNKLRVTQEGSDADCGFGHNVIADGTYRKIRGGKPKFESGP
ncbi:MAG: hypothetical protein C5B55_05050 [Blastocatellia bacterium]|nr:MAG: hypothetical protein C5B55_05050 [Blastocatellia bacterium]